VKAAFRASFATGDARCSPGAEYAKGRDRSDRGLGVPITRGRMRTMTAATLLASWRDTPTRKAITDFVQDVTSAGSADYAEAAERVAVFDNDGTLWSEKPIPIQLDFTLFRMAELAQANPPLRGRQPYRAAVERDYRWLGEAMVKHYHGDDADLRSLMEAVGTAFGGMTVEDFSAEVSGWLASARTRSSAVPT
jgi:hypothetical protein